MAIDLAASVSSSVEMCFVTAALHTCQVVRGARWMGKHKAVFKVGCRDFLEGRGTGAGVSQLEFSSGVGSSVTLG